MYFFDLLTKKLICVIIYKQDKSYHYEVISMTKRECERIATILENMYANAILFEEEHNTDHSLKHSFMCGTLHADIEALAKIIRKENYDMLYIME